MAIPLEELVELQRQTIARLEAEVEHLQKVIAERDETIRQLQLRVEELQRAALRQAAPFRRPDQKKVPSDQKKKPGRKPGHLGAYRQAPRQVDQRIEVPLDTCPHCQSPVSERSPLMQIIEEIPPCRPRVFRVITFSGKCPKCGIVHSQHPLQTSRAQGAASTLLGPRALALAALLNKHLGLTMRKTCSVLSKVCGLKVTPGGLSQALDRAADRVAGNYEQLLEQIRGSPAVFADETGWWVGGPQWLWTFTTANATVYRVDKRRNAEVVFDVLGEDFPGMLVSDCLVTYDKPRFRKHKCIAHHLQAIAAARDRPEGDTPYLQAWRLFFTLVRMQWVNRATMEPDKFEQGCAYLRARRDELLAQEVELPGDVAVRNRLEKQHAHLLGCLEEPAAEPTNNRAERSLRPAVITRKVSCGNKTERGKTTWQILASLAETCRQQAADFLDWLTPRLTLAPVR